MATQVSIFGIVVGVALLLSGIGFAILAVLSIGGSEGGSRPARAVESGSTRGDGQR
jgi:hypothetical protein